MTKQTPIVLDLNDESRHTTQRPQLLKWCDGHWASLMESLRTRGLDEHISKTQDELNERLARGDMDPCFEAFSIVNTGAFQIFGAEKVVKGNNGCPACAFANIVDHAADLMLTKHGDPH